MDRYRKVLARRKKGTRAYDGDSGTMTQDDLNWGMMASNTPRNQMVSRAATSKKMPKYRTSPTLAQDNKVIQDRTQSPDRKLGFGKTINLWNHAYDMIAKNGERYDINGLERTPAEIRARAKARRRKG